MAPHTKTDQINVDSEDLYSIFGVEKDAGFEEIRANYKRLVLIYHPDKVRNIDGITEEEANKIFVKITETYDILSNSNLRAFYDTFGFKNLKRIQNQIQLVNSDKFSMSEILKEYAKYTMEAKNNLLFNKINPNGTLKVYIDGQSLFDDQQMFMEYPFDIYKVSLKQSIDLTFNDRSRCSLGGKIIDEQGLARRSFFIDFFYLISEKLKFQGSLDSKLASFSLGVNYALNTKSSITLNSSQSLAKHFEPRLSLAYGRSFGQSVLSKSSITFSSNLYLISNDLIFEKTLFDYFNRFQLSFTFGKYYDFKAHQTIKNQSKSTSVINELRIGMIAKEFSTLVEKKVADYLKLLSKVDIKLGQGIRMWLGLKRKKYSYVFPTKLIDFVDPSVSLYSYIALMSFNVLVHFIGIHLNKNRESKVDEEKKENALKYQDEMKAIYIKTVKEESIQGGLVIQKAIFGPVDVRDGKILNIEQSVDVTIPLQLIVSNHRLTIGSFNAMLLIEGIYDPAPETVKKIMIRYIFQEKIHSVILNDKEPIELPDASHLS